MLGVIHHNANLDAELAGERVITRVTQRIGRASGLPNDRLHKTVIMAWQLELMNFIISNATGGHFADEDEIYDQFEDVNFDYEFDEENNNQPNNDELDEYFLHYFENAINL